MELTREELIVLAASARVMMMADGEISEGEIEIVERFAPKLGLTDDDWEDLWDEAVRTFRSTDAVAAAAALQRGEAREIVYGLLYELATDGTIVDSEWDILEWLDETWMSKPPTSS